MGPFENNGGVIERCPLFICVSIFWNKGDGEWAWLVWYSCRSIWVWLRL